MSLPALDGSDRETGVARGHPGRRRRVALDWTPAVRQSAGIGRFTRELGRALVERGRFEYALCVMDRLIGDALVAAKGDVPRGPDGRPAHMVISGWPAAWHARVWHRLRLPVPVERWCGAADIFHATDFLAPPTRSTARIVTIHDLTFLRHPERAEPSLARFLARAVPRSVQGAEHVLADSECTRADVIELLDVEPERVSVAYGGVGTSMRRVHDPAALDAVRGTHGLDKSFILGVGTLEPRKDWPTLIRAFAAEEKVRDGRSLIIAGGHGWRTDPILEAAERARTAGADVRLIGFVADADLPALYSLAHAFAFPSVYEGFGLPPLEAMACGVPTAVADAGSLPEVVGDAALRVPPGDVAAWRTALARLVDDPRVRDDLARRGPERAARFTWSACAAAVETAYEHVLGSRASFG